MFEDLLKELAGEVAEAIGEAIIGKTRKSETPKQVELPMQQAERMTSSQEGRGGFGSLQSPTIMESAKRHTDMEEAKTRQGSLAMPTLMEGMQGHEGVFSQEGFAPTPTELIMPEEQNLAKKQAMPVLPLGIKLDTHSLAQGLIMSEIINRPTRFGRGRR